MSNPLFNLVKADEVKFDGVIKSPSGRLAAKITINGFGKSMIRDRKDIDAMLDKAKRLEKKREKACEAACGPYKDQHQIALSHLKRVSSVLNEASLALWS